MRKSHNTHAHHIPVDGTNEDSFWMIFPVMPHSRVSVGGDADFAKLTSDEQTLRLAIGTPEVNHTESVLQMQSGAEG